MCYLLLDKSNKHIREMSDNPFDYDFINTFTLWEEVEIPNKTVLEVRSDYPSLSIEPIDPDNKDDGMKWLNPSDDKWYEVKVKKHHSQRWDTDTSSIKNIIEDYSENYETEIT